MLQPAAERLTSYLDLLSARQKLTSANVANLDTPGYQAKDIDFDSEFQNQLASGDPRVINVANLQTRNDGNNVNLDRESRILAETTMRFQMATKLLSSEMRVLRTAIQDGK